MSNIERTIHSEILERIEKSETEWQAGDKMLDVTIDYKKEAYRNRPRGYYLCLQVSLVTGTSRCVALSFGEEGDPHKHILIEETKAFSQKKFDAITVPADVVAAHVDAMKVEYQRRRAVQLAKRQQEAERRALATV